MFSHRSHAVGTHPHGRVRTTHRTRPTRIVFGTVVSSRHRWYRCRRTDHASSRQNLMDALDKSVAVNFPAPRDNGVSEFINGCLLVPFPHDLDGFVQGGRNFHTITMTSNALQVLGLFEAYTNGGSRPFLDARSSMDRCRDETVTVNRSLHEALHLVQDGIGWNGKVQRGLVDRDTGVLHLFG